MSPLRPPSPPLTSSSSAPAIAARGDEALRLIEELGPDVAVLDIAMEPLGGIEIARQIAETRPETRTILYTGHADREYLAQALDAVDQQLVGDLAHIDAGPRQRVQVRNGVALASLRISDSVTSSPSRS